MNQDDVMCNSTHILEKFRKTFEMIDQCDSSLHKSFRIPDIFLKELIGQGIMDFILLIVYHTVFVPLT